MHGSAIIGQSFSTFCHCVGHRPAVVRVRAGRGAPPLPTRRLNNSQSNPTTPVTPFDQSPVHLRPDRMMYARARTPRTPPPPPLLFSVFYLCVQCSVFVALRPRQPRLIIQVMGCFIRSRNTSIIANHYFSHLLAGAIFLALPGTPSVKHALSCD